MGTKEEFSHEMQQTIVIYSLCISTRTIRNTLEVILQILHNLFFRRIPLRYV